MASKNSVTTEIGAKDTGEMERILGRQQQEIDKLKNKLKDMGTTGKGTFDAQVKDAAKVVAGYMSISQAVHMATEEVRKLQELQLKAAGAQLDVNAGRQNLLLNLVGSDQKTIKEVFHAVEKISKDQGIAEKYVSTGMASAISASGGNVPLAISAMQMAGKTIPHSPELLGRYAGSMLDLQKVTGSTDMEINRGYLGMVSKLSRVAEPELQAKNIPAAIIGAKEFGASPEAAAAAYAALTSGAADPEGRRSGTALIALAMQLEKFLPSAGHKRIVEGSGKSKKIIPEIPSGLDSMEKRIEFMQGHQDIAKLFVEGYESTPGLGGEGGASFEKKLFAQVRGLLMRPDSVTAQQYRENLKVMPNMARMKELSQEMDRNKMMDLSEPFASKDRTYKQAAESILLENTSGAQAGIARKGLPDVLDASGQGWMQGKLRDLKWEWRTRLGTQNVKEANRKAVEDRISEIMSGATTEGESPGISQMYRGPSNVPRPLTGDEKKSIELLRGLLDKLDSIDSKTAAKSPTLTTHPQEDK
jgi:hypothetical protein